MAEAVRKKKQVRKVSSKKTVPRKSARASASGGRGVRKVSARTAPEWARLTDDELLDLRFSQLGLSIEGSNVEPRVQRLYWELERFGFRFRPHVWLGEEWFSPDGVPGIAIPFYLAHPRLVRLERKMMLEVEGGTEKQFMKILRHEAGHALDTAYRLHRRRRFRELFGSYSQPYPETYQPKPYSKSYVLHLDLWYAQSHPSEDFAETFAVWLRPRSNWRAQYKGWSAMRKLRYVDELMLEIRKKPALVSSRRHVEAIRSDRRTLREHYEEKRSRYGVDYPDVYDRELRRLFSDDPQHAKNMAAATFLKRIRPEVRRTVARWTGQYQYMIDQVLGEVIERCRELGLRLECSEQETKQDALVMLSVQTMNHLHGGHHRLAL